MGLFRRQHRPEPPPAGSMPQPVAEPEPAPSSSAGAGFGYPEDGERGFFLYQQAVSSIETGDLANAERFYREAIDRDIAGGEDISFVQSQFAYFLCDQGREDEAIPLLEALADLGTDLAGPYGRLIELAAGRHELDRMVDYVGKIPRSLMGDSSVNPWFSQAISAAVREGELDWAESICRRAREIDLQAGRSDGADWSTGELGAVLEKAGRLDEAMAEWGAAFAAGSTDPQTANRLTMHLVREKRDAEATAVLEVALTRGLPANVEETLRKRLEKLRHRGEPKAAKRDVPIFSVRHGEHFLQLVSQERLSPPAGGLASSGDVAIVTGITKGELTMTRVNLGTGERSTVTGLPVFSNLHVMAKGWAIAEQRLAGVSGIAHSRPAFPHVKCAI